MHWAVYCSVRCRVSFRPWPRLPFNLGRPLNAMSPAHQRVTPHTRGQSVKVAIQSYLVISGIHMVFPPKNLISPFGQRKNFFFLGLFDSDSLGEAAFSRIIPVGINQLTAGSNTCIVAEPGFSVVVKQSRRVCCGVLAWYARNAFKKLKILLRNFYQVLDFEKNQDFVLERANHIPHTWTSKYACPIPPLSLWLGLRTRIFSFFFFSRYAVSSAPIAGP